MTKICGPRKFAAAMSPIFTPMNLGAAAVGNIGRNAGRYSIMFNNVGPLDILLEPEGFDASVQPFQNIKTLDSRTYDFDTYGPLVTGSWRIVGTAPNQPVSITEIIWNITGE